MPDPFTIGVTRKCAGNVIAVIACPRPNRISGSMDTLIYKIMTAEQWRTLQDDGVFGGAPVDLADGFIHFSTASQAAGTAAKHFAGQDGLVLAAVRTAGLGSALKHEPSRGGDLFPHLYAPLQMADVAWTKPLPVGPDGNHVFPELDG